MPRLWLLQRSANLLLACLFVTSSAWTQSLPPIIANPNHARAGVLKDGVLTIHLEIAQGEWHPEAEDGVGLSVYAFGETGRPLQNPGPLIRVPQGTVIHASVHNALAEPISVHGLGDPLPTESVLHLAPDGIGQVSFTASTPGLYFYWGASTGDDLRLRHGIDSELTGALVVDPPGAIPDDEIFVMGLLSEVPGAGARKTLATINGKSWPYTQHFQYEVGQAAHWRWINPTNEPHALHLHGFFFRVDAFNHGGRIESYSGSARPKVVTQRIAQGETFDMTWSPERAGQWLFHCHMLQHMTPPVIPRLPGLAIVAAQEAQHDHGSLQGMDGMGQMVLGITVPDRAKNTKKAAWHAERKLQLEINERASVPRYQLRVRDLSTPDAPSVEPGLIGPPIVLTRDQPVEIEIVNKLKEPTAIHWHGIELESYYDGVPGWSGAGREITPAIAPGESFVARMAPPRAGTFIYHTHWHDPAQLLNGIYGPLIVLPPGEKFDPESDRVFVLSIGDFGELREIALINGTPQSKTLQLETGKKYRFRFINISTNNQGMQVSLRNSSGLTEWTAVAKDGVDLPGDQVHPTKAQFTITVGETRDVTFSTANVQDLQLELLLPAQKIHIVQTLSFVEPAAGVKR